MNCITLLTEFSTSCYYIYTGIVTGTGIETETGVEETFMTVIAASIEVEEGTIGIGRGKGVEETANAIRIVSAIGTATVKGICRDVREDVKSAKMKSQKRTRKKTISRCVRAGLVDDIYACAIVYMCDTGVTCSRLTRQDHDGKVCVPFACWLVSMCIRVIPVLCVLFKYR